MLMEAIFNKVTKSMRYLLFYFKDDKFLCPIQSKTNKFFENVICTL